MAGTEFVAIPYAPFVIVAIAALLVWALVWASRAAGRERERAKAAEEGVKLDQKVQDVVDAGRDHPVTVDDEWLHRPSDGPPAGGGVPQPPDAPR